MKAARTDREGRLERQSGKLLNERRFRQLVAPLVDKLVHEDTGAEEGVGEEELREGRVRLSVLVRLSRVSRKTEGVPRFPGERKLVSVVRDAVKEMRRTARR